MRRSPSVRPPRTGSMRPGRSGSIHPAARSASGRKVDSILRTLGKPEPELLEALLDGMNLGRMVEKSRAVAVTELLETAFVVHVQAYEFLQTCTREQRAQLRTCSHQLIALGMERSCHLEALHRRELERARERQEALRRLEYLAGVARSLRGQAAEMLAKVGGADPSEVGEPAEFADAPPALLARALGELAAQAKALMAHPSTKVQLRTTLYGLDRAYVESLVGVAAELDHLQRVAPAGAAAAANQGELDAARAVVLFMVQHFVGAFDAARRADKTIPVLDARRLAASAAKPAPDSVPKLTLGGGAPPGAGGPRRP